MNYKAKCDKCNCDLVVGFNKQDTIEISDRNDCAYCGNKAGEVIIEKIEDSKCI